MREATIRRLNWGCDFCCPPGWINSDRKEGPGIDISCDILNGLPLDMPQCSLSALELPRTPLP